MEVCCEDVLGSNLIYKQRYIDWAHQRYNQRDGQDIDTLGNQDYGGWALVARRRLTATIVLCRLPCIRLCYAICWSNYYL
jgi:hypothetical protein